MRLLDERATVRCGEVLFRWWVGGMRDTEVIADLLDMPRLSFSGFKVPTSYAGRIATLREAILRLWRQFGPSAV